MCLMLLLCNFPTPFYWLDAAPLFSICRIITVKTEILILNFMSSKIGVMDVYEDRQNRKEISATETFKWHGGTLPRHLLTVSKFYMQTVRLVVHFLSGGNLYGA